MLDKYGIEQENALNFFRNWLRTYKYVQYLFLLIQDKKKLEVRRIMENRYLGVVEFFDGKYYLEFYQRVGEWQTDQETLMPMGTAR